jgi:hypothetical protein
MKAAKGVRAGTTVLDGFGGSGSTGLAAILCGCPTATMLREAERLGLPVRWGARMTRRVFLRDKPESRKINVFIARQA